MPDDPIQRRDGSFIIRIWWERSTSAGAGRGEQAEGGPWRGWIQHVRNGNQAYFTSVRDMTDFIAHETGVELADDPSALGLM
jgi:hypothetical protein